MQTSLFMGTIPGNMVEEGTLVKAGGKYRICAWNIQNAGMDRAKKIEAYLLENDFDIVILSEVTKKPSSEYLICKLGEAKYRTTSMHTSPERTYHTVILSKLKFTSLPIKTTILRNRTKIIRLDLEGRDNSFYIVGLYGYPDNIKNKETRKLFQSAVINNVVARLSWNNKNAIIVGDLNVVESDFHNHCKSTVTKDAHFFHSMENYGFRDLVREVFPATPNYTWVCPRTGEGQRLDHLFVANSALGAISCLKLDHSVRISKTSDHSALTFCIST